jgi:hypothetical protein
LTFFSSIFLKCSHTMLVVRTMIAEWINCTKEHPAKSYCTWISTCIILLHLNSKLLIYTCILLIARPSVDLNNAVIKQRDLLRVIKQTQTELPHASDTAEQQ